MDQLSEESMTEVQCGIVGHEKIYVETLIGS